MSEKRSLYTVVARVELILLWRVACALVWRALQAACYRCLSEIVYFLLCRAEGGGDRYYEWWIVISHDHLLENVDIGNN